MSHKLVLLDLETQRDFFLLHGPCSVPESPVALHHILELFTWARRENIFVISTVLRNRPGQHSTTTDIPHCIEGTKGEIKARGTLLPNRINLGMHNDTDIPSDLLESYQQAIFEKRTNNIFTHAKLERLISEIPTATFIICGAGMVHIAAHAAIGLRSRGSGVILASDATTTVDIPAGKMAQLRMKAKGVVFARTSQIVSQSSIHITTTIREKDRAG